MQWWKDARFGMFIHWGIYSVPSGKWGETHKGDMNKYVEEIAIPQVKEILANYGAVAVLWWDTPINMTQEMAQKLADLTKPYPTLITNKRLGAGMGDLETPEQFVPAPVSPAATGKC